MYFVSFLSSLKFWPLRSWQRLNKSMWQHANKFQLLPAVGSLIPRFLKHQRPASILMAETSWTNIQEISCRLVNNENLSHSTTPMGTANSWHCSSSAIHTRQFRPWLLRHQCFHVPNPEGLNFAWQWRTRVNDGHTGRFPFSHSHPKSDVLQQVLCSNTQGTKQVPPMTVPGIILLWTLDHYCFKSHQFTINNFSFHHQPPKT